MKHKEKKDILKAIPLGGHGEIGKNCWLFEYKDEIVIVNFGMMLPGWDVSGVDLVFPCTDYLAENQDKIKALVITSGHDDSCGGVFYLLNKVKIPKIIGSKLAVEMLKNENIKNLPDIEFLESRKEFKIGETFLVKPIANTSTLPDTYGLYIKTDGGNILYTGSFKVDQTPPDNILFDYYSYSEAGESGVDLLISDSTNAESVGYSQPERAISKRFNELFKDSSSRIIILSYANNLHKFQIIFDLAGKNKRKVFISSDCLSKKIDSAIKSGFLKADKSLFLHKENLKEVQDNELIILASGKYGDFLQGLIEIAKGEHAQIKLKPKDVVVVSSTPPPGTARILAHTIDQLFVQKVQVIGGRGQGVHVSGHAAQEEVKLILTMVKPRSFIPSHGEERQMVICANIAELIGVSPNDIHILKNGEVLELREQIARVANKISSESIYYNCAKGLDIDEITMKERQSLSEEGTITVALTIDKDRNIIAGPEIFAEACSFAKGKDWRAFCLGAVELINDAVKKAVENKETNLLNLKATVRDTLNKSVLELISKRPLINVSIQEVVKSKC